jgi:hypothetical protein
LAGEAHAANILQAYLDVYTHHYLQAKHQLPVDWLGDAHARLNYLRKWNTATGAQSLEGIA